jgi:hypothetical protein
MYSQSMPIGLLVARYTDPDRDPARAIIPCAVVTDMPPLPVGTLLRRETDRDIVYAGDSTLVLYPGESAHYEDNLLLDPPRVWVSLRPDPDHIGSIAAISVDPYEGEAMADVESDIVEALPMPQAVRLWLAEFLAEFPPKRDFYKRKRDEGMGSRKKSHEQDSQDHDSDEDQA